MSLTLVIGGTRSGKSAHAERLASESGRPVVYVGTAAAEDSSMEQRVAGHRARRPADWQTLEVGDLLVDALGKCAPDDCVLLDGIGPWIATVLHNAGAFDESPGEAIELVTPQVEGEIAQLVERIPTFGELIVVAEQAGEGVLPNDSASRAWLDLIGSATQRLAAAADRVELVVAGRPLALSRPPVPGSELEFAALRSHGDKLVRPGDTDHAVNILDGDRPQWLSDALHAALEDDSLRYPDETDAVRAIASLHGREENEVVPTNGAAEALWLLPAALKPRLVACVHPGFTEAEAAIRAHGVDLVRVLRDPERAFALDPASVPDAADLVILGNPVSPTGTLDPATAVLALRKPGRTIVVDEAFMDLVPGEAASLVGERLEDVIVVRSLTKSFAVPGLRVGYAIAAAPLAARLRAVRPPWSANALALAALAAAARRPESFSAAAEQANSQRDDLAARLARIDGVRSWPSTTNFCLIEVADGPAVAAALRDRSIAIRPAESFPGLHSGHLRLTARDAGLNALLADALDEAVANA
ncbi:MAG: bifunctional adenosylcobinamide kinase/adenosylcobinamide-phosphate guanylyltransferase [Solirubrobacterales bacterium]